MCKGSSTWSIILIHRVAASRSKAVREVAAKSTQGSAEVSGEIWRAVESQHVISTMRLVDDDLADQTILERIVDESKPPVPANAQHLHWLLATPFRYAVRMGGSRFRARGQPGVLYGATVARTACAEAGFWKWRFVQDSAGLTKLDAHPMTLFPAKVRGRAWNLTELPFSKQRKQWTQPNDYAPTQALAARARSDRIALIVYESVRDPDKGDCTAVLDPKALVNNDPLIRSESWYLTVLPRGVIWRRDRSRAFQFDFRRFAQAPTA